MNLSSFSLPDTYYGQGFKSNSTALPQTQFANAVVTLSKGSTAPVTVSVAKPEACKATQVDLYYGQNQTQITTSEGLVGTDAIVGKIYPATGTCVTTTAVQTPQPTPTPAPQPVQAALPETGVSPVLGMLEALLLAAGAYLSVRLFRASRS